MELRLDRIERYLRRVFSPRSLRLVEGFWTVPLIISTFGVLFALAVEFAPASLAWALQDTLLGRVTPEGGRLALSAVASGVMTVAGLVFSLMFVALSITAQMLSPRILDFVIRQRSMQVLIGLAISTFLFSTITLALASPGDNWRFALSVPIALILSAATLGLVVGFAHQMTRVMRVEEMVVRLRDAYLAAIDGVIAGPADTRVFRSPEPDHLLESAFETDGVVVETEAGGYVGYISYTGLVEAAEGMGLRIRLEVHENDHVLPGMALATVIGVREGEDWLARRAIRGQITMTDRREVAKGADYEAASLSEAALRALSPSLNDTATALSCVNTLYEGLARLAVPGRPPSCFADASGQLRLIARPRGIVPLLDDAVMPIASWGKNDYRMARRLRELTAHLERLVPDEETRRGVRAFAVRLEGAGTQPDLASAPRPRTVAG